EAMKKRITLMQTEFQTSPPKSIMELVVSSDPDYKLAYALELASALITNGGSAIWVHNNVGFNSIESLANYITKQGYSVNNIRRIATNPELSWNEMCQAIYQEYQNGPQPDPIEVLESENSTFLNELNQRSKLDKKDFF